MRTRTSFLSLFTIRSHIRKDKFTDYFHREYSFIILKYVRTVLRHTKTIEQDFSGYSIAISTTVFSIIGFTRLARIGFLRLISRRVAFPPDLY